MLEFPLVLLASSHFPTDFYHALKTDGCKSTTWDQN